jgi:two-component system, cell cycle sensor histidine kinase and response regulator CckA
MQHAPTPENESERLAALRRYDILDTPPEADFDDFARLASQICGMPIATITLIDAARQWFKSNIGMEANETPRDISFCGHTILGSEVLEVPNALEDERFRDSPLVTGAQKIRFYAGAPLVTPDGLNIGALCVLGQTPHHLTPKQREMLVVLSRQVVHSLELRLAGRRIKWLNENLEQLVAKRTEELAKDIAERKRAEESNIRSLALLRATLDSTADGILTIGSDRQILSFNEIFVKMWRIPSDLLAANSDDLAIEWVLEQLKTPEHFLAKVRDLYDHPLAESFDVLEFKDGRVFERYSRPMLDEGRPLGRVWSFRDVTEKKKIEARFMRTQRMESLGTLAGGIAHDLNNSLAPIMMVAGLLRERYPNEANLVDTVESSAKRGADMVRQLLTFAKGVDGERLPVNPQGLLKEMSKIIEGTFPKNIQLRTVYGKNLEAIRGDATQLHQVLLNLCVNARDAMPNGGILTLEAENTEIDATYASAIPDAKPGRYVVWRVTDTGTGIPPEILERIFEPFFSTKGPEKGTGLGLSTVIGIVKSHGGFAQIYSVPGQGSTFAIYLPADKPCDPESSAPPSSGTDFRGRGETILVVDDEANVREAVRAVLTSLNFKVAMAANGTEALVQAAEKRAELRAVITDQHMPGIDGLTLARVLKGMLPEVAIIVASGRIEEQEKKQFKTLGITAVLDKPFTQKKLEEALRASWLALSPPDEEAEPVGDGVGELCAAQP